MFQAIEHFMALLCYLIIDKMQRWYSMNMSRNRIVRQTQAAKAICSSLEMRCPEELAGKTRTPSHPSLRQE